VSWLVVTGGAHRRGGQDRANLELIRYLSARGREEVHVVTHDVDPEVSSFKGVRLQIVPRLLGSTVLGERVLERAANRIHARLGPSGIVVANGGNYPRSNVNWVHSIHAVWPVRDEGAPLSRRLFNRAKKWDARVRESRAFHGAELLIANSPKTAMELVSVAQVPSERVVTIGFGSDPAQRAEARSAEGIRLAFVGALGWDRNKGLDIALEALRLLTTTLGEKTTLLVAGPGAVGPWVRRSVELGLAHRVTFLGMVEDVPALLRRVDLLISPVRYEAYGLAIQEALVAGTPALVSGAAGIAPRIREVLPQLVVSEQENPKAWARAIEDAARNLQSVRDRVARLGEELARRSWEQMAAEIVSEIEARLVLGRR